MLDAPPPPGYLPGMRSTKFIDVASASTLVITLVLFGLAVVEKGLTHDLLLEAGVFLVSVKLVISSYKSEARLAKLDQRLAELQATLAPTANRQ